MIAPIDAVQPPVKSSAVQGNKTVNARSSTASVSSALQIMNPLAEIISATASSFPGLQISHA
jgi:hypothetical protein